MSVYLTTQDVAQAPGQLSTLWATLGGGAQEEYLNEVSARIDDLTHQNGGLLTQTGKQATLWIESNTDTLILPNRPVTNVSAVSVLRYGQTQTLPTTGTAIALSGGQSVVYDLMSAAELPNGLSVVTFNLYGHMWPFQEGDRVTVTYDCGYASVPYPVKRAALQLLAQMLFTTVQNPAGGAQVRQGRSMVSHGTTTYINVAETQIDKWLEPYTCWI